MTKQYALDQVAVNTACVAIYVRNHARLVE